MILDFIIKSKLLLINQFEFLDALQVQNFHFRLIVIYQSLVTLFYFQYHYQRTVVTLTFMLSKLLTLVNYTIKFDLVL